MKINISNLTDGLEFYKFVEDCHSLNIEESIFTNPIDVKVSINKMRKNLVVNAQVRTVANFTCDRCLEAFSTVLTDEVRLIYTTDKGMEAKLEEEIRWISPGTKELDITQDVREALLLSIPVKRLCSEECKGLCPGCGANLNKESCQCIHQKIDPRWEALRKLRKS